MANYSSLAEVQALTKKYTARGSYTSTTNPTREQVETFLDQVSSALNVYLANEGFAIPVTNAVVKPMLDGLCSGFVKDMIEAANAAGRFFVNKRLNSFNPFTVINRELGNWVDAHAQGLDAAGATRTTTVALGIGVRDTDDAGNEVEPIFQREDFGNSSRP